MDIKLNTEGDIDYRSGDILLARGVDAIKQELEIRLRSFRGEWFLDESIGIPYFDDVLKKNPDQTVLNTIFTRAITETPGILSLNELNFSLLQNRTLEISLSATTEDGEINLTLVGV